MRHLMEDVLQDQCPRLGRDCAILILVPIRYMSSRLKCRRLQVRLFGQAIADCDGQRQEMH